MKKTKARKIILGGMTLLAFLFVMLNGTLANPSYSNIINFELENLVYEKSVDVGMSWEELGLPASLRAVVKIENGEITEEIITSEPIMDNTTTEKIPNNELMAEETIEPTEDPPEPTAPAEDPTDPTEQSTDEPEEPTEEDEDEEGEEELIEPPEELPGSISGFIWIDENEDGLFDEEEQPLADYTVYLYMADDLDEILDVTQTDEDGIYRFDDLESGSYVLGLNSGFSAGAEYLLPMMITKDNKFAVDWLSDPLTSYTKVIELEEGQIVMDINAGMRLPMGVTSTATVTLANLKNAKKNDQVSIDGYTWNVVRTQVLVSTGETCVLLALANITNYNNGSASYFSNTSTIYETSLLRTRMTNYYNSYPTIKAIAVKPELSDTFTNPSAQMAGSQTVDIMFALSYRDALEWNSNVMSPLTPTLKSYGVRFWLRTAYTASALYGINPTTTTGTIDNGLHYLSGDIGDVPAVWVNANAVEKMINVFYVDAAGNPIGSPSFAAYPVTIGNTFTLDSSEIPNIKDYNYKEWKIGLSGVPNTTLPVSVANVTSNIDIHLVYEKIAPTKIKVTVIEKYVDVNGNAIPGKADTETKVAIGGSYSKTIPTITGYLKMGYKIDAAPSGIGTFDENDPAQIAQVDIGTIVYFVYEKIDIISVKNAHVNSDPIDNGESDKPVAALKGDKITYEIIFYNRNLPKTISNPMFFPKLAKPQKINFINGSFEEPQTATNTQTSGVPGWTNTAEPLIEIHHVGSNATFAPSAPDGTQYAELNATMVGTLYQTVTTVPGSKVYWEFYHGARGINTAPAVNTDVMDFLLGPTPGTGVQQVRATDSWVRGQPYKWGYYFGSYIVPAGQTSTAFSFKSVSSTGGNNSVGNFLDAVRLYTPSYIELTKSNNAPGGKAKFGDIITYTIVVKNVGESDAANVMLSDILPIGTELIPGTMAINGTATNNYDYDASTRTVDVNVGEGADSSFGGLIKGDGSFSTDCDNSYTVTFQIQVGDQEIAENYKYESQSEVTYEDRYDTARDEYTNYSNVDEFILDMHFTSTVIDIIPEGLKIISVSHNGSIDSDNRTITWDIDESYEDGMIELTVVTEVTEGESGDKLDNIATISPWFANDHDTNYTYHELIPAIKLTDVTITKTVTGSLGNKTKPFKFTVYIPEKIEETIDYYGTNAPSGGILVFDENGEASFNLKDGQYITLKEIPADYQIKVVEALDNNYQWSYTDSEDENDLGDKEMELKIVGNINRVFAFVNDRIEVIPTGIGETTLGIWTLIWAVLIISASFFGIEFIRKNMY